jgi:hypothetical protein
VNMLINERVHGGSVPSDKGLGQCQDRAAFVKGNWYSTHSSPGVTGPSEGCLDWNGESGYEAHMDWRRQGPADPAARGSQTHRIVKLPVGSFELNSVLLTEGSILDPS